MGIDRSGTYLRGILVPDPRISASNITPKDHATAPSTYTEAGPFAGPAEPDQDTSTVLRTSGEQSADGHLEVLTHRSGGARLEGAGFVWRDVGAGDSASQYKSVDPPAVITDWEALYWTTTVGGSNIRPTVIRLASGRLLACVHVSSVGVVLMERFDPATDSWTSANMTPTNGGAGYITTAATILQLPSGRVLAFCLAYDQQQIDVYWSDDDGDNWTAAGYRVLSQGIAEATVDDIRAAYSPETSEIVLFVMWSNSTTGENTASQYASADLGSEFVSVVADWEVTTGESIETLDLAPMVGGGFCVVYIDEQPVNDDIQRRRIGSAFDAITASTASEPDSSISPALDDVTIWADEEGVMWLLAGDGTTSFEGRLGSLYRSLDQGDTWEDGADCQGTHHLHTGTTSTNRLTDYSAATIGGRTCLVSRWTASGSSYDPQSVCAVWYAGASSHTAPVADESPSVSGAPPQEDFRDTDFIGWGNKRDGDQPGGVWLPVEIPSSVNWTAAGAGSEAFVVAEALEITTTAGQSRDQSRIETDDDVVAVFLDFEVELDGGDGSTSAEEVTFTVRLADQAFQFEIQVRLSSSGYRLYDVNAAANVDAVQTFDLTSKGHIRLAMDDGGHVRTWHGRGGSVREWTEGAEGSGLTDGGAGANNLIKWGHTGAAANVSRWTMVGYCFYPGLWSGTKTDDLAASWANPDDLRSRSFPTAPALVHDGVQIQAVSGPSWVGETWQIETAYEHPVKACLPQTSPSPHQGWRSTTDGAAYNIAFDLEREAGFADSFWESSSLGVFLVESNLQHCKLQGWDGAAWQDLVSLDASDGFGSRAYKRKGRIVSADTAAPPTGERWSPHQMHAGDSMALEDGEDTVYRRIASNSEGGWRSGSKLARLMLNAEDLDGGEDATGTGTIYRRNFGGVVHDLSVYYRYIRLHIPAQKTWSGDYRIGSLLIGPVFVFGLQYGNGWAYETASNTDLQTRTSGSRSARVLGPRRRAVEVSWADQPQDTTRMWDSEPSPDYVTGVTSGDPVASIADTAYQVLGLTERTDGPASPVVYIGKIDRGSGDHLYTMDPEWLYGRITTEVASVDHVVGEEGVSAVLRTNRVRIEEEV